MVDTENGGILLDLVSSIGGLIARDLNSLYNVYSMTEGCRKQIKYKQNQSVGSYSYLVNIYCKHLTEYDS